MPRLAHTTSTAEIVAVNATTAPFPPVTAAAVPDSWGNLEKGHVPGFDVDISAAAAATGVTDVLEYAAELEALVYADATFTSTHGSDLFTIAGHGLITGDGPFRVSSSGGLPAGLAAGTDYYVIYVSANTFKLALTRALAFAGTQVATTSDGTGVHTLADTASTMQVKWKRIGTLAAAPTLSAREGVKVRCEHSPRHVAYGTVWTGTASSAVKAKICPVLDR